MGSLKATIPLSNVLKYIFSGFKIGSAMGFVGSLFSSFYEGKMPEIDNLLLDTFVGGFSGALLGPIGAAGGAVSWSTIGLVGLYGGVENFITDEY